MTDYEANSRFTNDPEFKVVTRKGTTIGTINIMPSPVRGPNDALYTVPLRHQYRWDLVAEELLGDPGLKWVVMRHNRVEDPFTGPLVNDRLLIPSSDQVQYYLQKNQ